MLFRTDILQKAVIGCPCINQRWARSWPRAAIRFTGQPRGRCAIGLFDFVEQHYSKKRVNICGSRGGTRDSPFPPPPTYFWTKMRPEGRKKKFETFPPPSQGLDDHPHPPHLKVWIRHWWIRVNVSRGVGYNFLVTRRGLRASVPLLAGAQRNSALCKAQFSPSSWWLLHSPLFHLRRNKSFGILTLSF